MILAAPAASNHQRPIPDAGTLEKVMHTITFVRGRELRAISVPSRSTAITVAFALNSYGFRARVWNGREMLL